MSYTPGSLVVVTGTVLDTSDPDTTCWLTGDQPLGHFHTVTKGATGVVLAEVEDKLKILLDDATTVWIWTDAVSPI